MSDIMFQDDNEMLHDVDFPDYFINKHHPDDYKLIRDYYIEKIYNTRTDHNRLILRICVKLGNVFFVPISFICDTGAPSYLYFNPVTYRLIAERILRDELGMEYLLINEKVFPIKNSPPAHHDVNIIGLRALNKFGFFMDEPETFDFLRLPNYI